MTEEIYENDRHRARSKGEPLELGKQANTMGTTILVKWLNRIIILITSH